jgi:hypothetical protein
MLIAPYSNRYFLCTYHGAASEILPSDQVKQKILIPEIREKLKELHNGQNQNLKVFYKIISSIYITSRSLMQDL